VLVIALLASVAWATDVSIAMGMGLQTPVPIGQSAGRLEGGLVFGTSLGLDPLRVEAQTMFGTQVREGTADVWVSDANLELAVLGGWRGTFVETRRFGFGLDALAGPAGTWTRSRTSLFGDETRASGFRPRLALSVGPWTQLGPVQVGARFQAYAPTAPQWSAFGTVGFAF
jgi:hypothetical protein